MRPIAGFPNYLVSEDGEVYSVKFGKPRPLKKRPHRQGYVVYVLYRKGLPNGKAKMAHLLVAAIWLPPKPSTKHEINHINNKKDDNRWQNLEWGTKSHNCLHREKYRRQPAWSGRKTPQRMIDALRMMAAGGTKEEVQRATKYSRSMVRFLFSGQRGSSVLVTKNGHEAR